MVINSYISSKEIMKLSKSLLSLNCQYLLQNTITNFTIPRKKQVLTQWFLLYFIRLFVILADMLLYLISCKDLSRDSTLLQFNNFTTRFNIFWSNHFRKNVSGDFCLQKVSKTRHHDWKTPQTLIMVILFRALTLFLYSSQPSL